MAEIVDPTEIERIVGARRGHLHKAIAIRDEGVFILHSHGCLARGALLDCSYTKAMENGLLDAQWWWCEDMPMIVKIRRMRVGAELDRLVPVCRAVR